jgi:hypothetical protein
MKLQKRDYIVMPYDYFNVWIFIFLSWLKIHKHYLFIYLSVLDANEGRKPGTLVEKLKKLIDLDRPYDGIGISHL